MESKLGKQTETSTYAYSGFVPYTVKGGDTLQRIAQSELGDESLWVFICSVNTDIEGNDDLYPGKVLLIPLENDAVSERSARFIISEDVIRDPYGTDIRVDSEGHIILDASNDVALLSGTENLLQAVDRRLRTNTGSMIKQTAYGLASSAGSAGSEIVNKYIRMNVINSLMQDPRITEVSDVRVTMEKDHVYVTANLELVNGASFIPINALLW